MESALTQRRSSLSISVSIDEVDPFPENLQSAKAPETSLKHSFGNQDTESSSKAVLNADDTSTSSDSSSSTGSADSSDDDDDEHRVEAGLRQPFVFQQIKPYSHISTRHFLARPTNPNEWCLRVLEQRWFQSIGNKLRISAGEFHWYANQGLEYLHMNNQACGELCESENRIHPSDCGCILDSRKFLLHKWAMDIMGELQLEIESEKTQLLPNGDGTWGPYRHLGDGTWPFPHGIVPEMVQYLPLPYSLRRKFFDLVSEKWKDVPNDISPFPETTFSAKRGKEIALADWNKKMTLRHRYLENIFMGISSLCWDIGMAMKQHLYDEFSSDEWNRILQEWHEDMENERKEAEWAAEEEARLEMEAREREEREEIVRKEKENGEQDRERRDLEEEFQEIFRLSPRPDGDSDTEDTDEPASSFPQTPNTTRASSTSLSAAEIDEIMKPKSFNWADDLDEDEFELEATASRLISDKHENAEKNQSSSAPSKYSLDEITDTSSAIVETDDLWTRSGSDIFAQELEADIDQSTNFHLPQSSSRVAAAPETQTPTSSDHHDENHDEQNLEGRKSDDKNCEEEDSVSLEELATTNNFNHPIVPDLSDSDNSLEQHPAEPTHEKSGVVSINEESATPGKLDSDMQLLDENLPSSLLPGDISRGEESVATQCGPGTDYRDMSSENIPTHIISDVQQEEPEDLVLSFDEPKPAISPISEILQDSETLLAGKASHVPLPESDDEGYESAASQEEGEMETSNPNQMIQSFASTLGTRVILPSGGSYGFAEPVGGSPRLAHLPVAPDQEHWRIQAMSHSCQSESHDERKSSGSGVQCAAISFAIISLGLHYSSEITEAVRSLF